MRIRQSGIFIVLVMCIAFFTAAGTARAQATPTPAAAPTLTRDEAQELLGVLNDPAKRANFTRTLSLMAKGLPAAATPAAPATGTSHSFALLHADLASTLQALRDQLLDYIANFLALFSNLATVGVWLHDELSDPAARKILIDAFTRAALVIGCALAVERVLALVLRPVLRRVTERAQSRETRRMALNAAKDDIDPSAITTEAARETRALDQQRQTEMLRLFARTPYALAHLCIKTVPVIVFFGVAYAGTLFATTTAQAATVTLTLGEAYAAARLCFMLVEAAFVPRSPSIRLIPATDATARLVTRWWTVLVAAPAMVGCLSVLGGEFDLASRGTLAMIRAVVLVEHILIAVFIWQLRPIVSRWLQPSAKGATSTFWSFAWALARQWWVPALFLDASLWLVWAARMHGGYEWILRTILITAVVIGAMRLAAVLAYGLQDRIFYIRPETAARYPDLQKRADHYYPFARTIITAFLTVVTLIVVTEAWGMPSIEFLVNNALASRLLGAAVTMVIAICLAALFWEIANGMLNRQLNRYTTSEQASRAIRLRTVMPIIRTMLLTTIIIIVLVTTLSQLGINIAPLLTGAGILGAAIAFGSQSLVKDFITGFFMLVENAIQVGDWVTTGGVSGTVEALSIRAVKVRDNDGDLHFIPFSSVSSIANTARSYNQIVVRQQVDLSEDIPRVVAIMAGVVQEMRADEAFRDLILSDYNDLGVDVSDSGGAAMVGTIRTAPMMKWKVKREFHRRLAGLLAEANVKFYTPTAYTTTPPGSPLELAGWVQSPMPSPGPLPTQLPSQVSAESRPTTQTSPDFGPKTGPAHQQEDHQQDDADGS